MMQEGGELTMPDRVSCGSPARTRSLESYWPAESLERKRGPDHGRLRLHFHPFGVLRASAERVNGYAGRHRAARGGYAWQN